MVSIPHFLFAATGKPFGRIHLNYSILNQMAGDTTIPAGDQKSTEKTAENTLPNTPAEVVKVIPKARRQPIPVPVKVKVPAVKIIKPKIIKPVVKPVIKILH